MSFKENPYFVQCLTGRRKVKRPQQRRHPPYAHYNSIEVATATFALTPALAAAFNDTVAAVEEGKPNSSSSSSTQQQQLRCNRKIRKERSSTHRYSLPAHTDTRECPGREPARE